MAAVDNRDVSEKVQNFSLMPIIAFVQYIFNLFACLLGCAAECYQLAAR